MIILYMQHMDLYHLKYLVYMMLLEYIQFDILVLHIVFHLCYLISFLPWWLFYFFSLRLILSSWGISFPPKFYDVFSSPLLPIIFRRPFSPFISFVLEIALFICFLYTCVNLSPSWNSLFSLQVISFILSAILLLLLAIVSLIRKYSSLLR